MPFRTMLLVGLLGFVLTALPLAAQQDDMMPWSPWGGPDSPGGLFGGDPRGAAGTGERDRPVTHDELWSWLAKRFEAVDANSDRAVTPDELRIAPSEDHRRAWFHRADTDRNGHLTPDELQGLAGLIILHHDKNRDGVLHRHEIRRDQAAGAQPAATPGR